MSKQYKNAIRIFFSDYLGWFLIISFLFIFSLVAAITDGNANGFIWIIPVLFLCLHGSRFPLLNLYCKARKDLKYNNIDKLTIKIVKIEQDDRFALKNRLGAVVGKRKYRIIDESGNYYLLSAANNKDMFLIFHPDLSFSVEVEFLNKSRLIMSMKLMEKPTTNKANRKQNYNIEHFKEVFRHYL